ncbi:MAG: hypothetical protein JSW27_17970, partial [Phycisphaerales bacterium]
MVSRRRFLRMSVAGAASAVLPASMTRSTQPGGRRPNVLIIIADDMNDYGFYDTLPGVKMPYLRRFQQ